MLPSGQSKHHAAGYGQAQQLQSHRLHCCSNLTLCRTTHAPTHLPRHCCCLRGHQPLTRPLQQLLLHLLPRRLCCCRDLLLLLLPVLPAGGLRSR
jgi:hypothetical protein